VTPDPGASDATDAEASVKAMRRCSIIIAALLGLSSCAGVPSQPARSPAAALPSPAPATTAAPAASAPVSPRDADARGPATDAADLTLGTGDLIEVSVFDVQELSNLKVRIPSSGAITLPLLGAVPAAGLTAGELQSVIRLRLQEKYMHDPQVSVFVTEHKSQRIYVSGPVKSPGPQELIGRVRLADALAMAGGLTDEAGRSVQVIRKRTDTPTPAVVTTVIDLDKLATSKDEVNMELQAGDVVEVARAGAYYVGGEVTRPGLFYLKTRTTVAQATVNAGGPKDVADWDDLRLYRRRPDGSTEVKTFSLNEFENGAASPELQADDVVIVGKSGLKVFLYSVRDFFKFGIGASLPIL